MELSMTSNATPRTPHDSRNPNPTATGAGLTTFDPGAGYVTIINTYTAPERADALVDLLVRATVETIRYVSGFVSANIHLSLDRTQVVNYAQWRSREAIAAARENPSVVARIREAGAIADSFTPVQDELRYSVAAASVCA
jgi:quinol monooxygenase YgiN